MSGTEAEPDREHLLLDELTERLDALKLLRHTDEAGADRILEEFGASGPVEREMVVELSKQSPLSHPDRFEQAHRTAIRALEVFDRNATRTPRFKRKLGPLTPVAAFVVQIFVRLITKNHQANVVTKMTNLYARREANTPKGTPEYAMLGLARRQMERLEARFRDQDKLGLPSFLLGGAVITSVSSALGSVADQAGRNEWVLIVALVVLALLALSSFWAVLVAAAVARRRIRICLDRPLHALWETIGAAGKPPRDESRQFAVLSLVFLVLAWLVVPAAVYLLVT